MTKNLIKLISHNRAVSASVYSAAILATLVGASAQAQETAAVLPKGIRRVRAVEVMGLGVDHSFDADGNRVDLLNKLNTVIPAATQAEQNADLKQLYDSLNAVESGLGDKLFQTDLYANGGLNFKRHTFAGEWGLTDRIALGVIVPIVQIKMTPEAGISVTSQGNAIISKLEGMQAASNSHIYDPLIQGVQTFESTKPTASFYENKIFTQNGYTAPGNTNIGGLGDIEVGGKWLFLKKDKLNLATESGFRLPTASHIADPSNVLDRSTGDKQWDFAVKGIATYEPITNLVFASMLKYTAQFGDTRRMPVPTKGQIGLTNLNDANNWDNVHRNLGDMWDAELAATFNFNGKAMYSYAAYDYAYKAGDSFKGSKNLDYASLAADTDSVSHKYEIGFGYTTIPLYRAKRFPVPMEFKVAFNNTLLGRNTIDAKYTRFDMYVFF